MCAISSAQSVDGNAVVGLAYDANGPHAMLWDLTTHAVVDLNPGTLPGITGSAGQAAHGSLQAGYGTGPSVYAHALLWNGTADSVVDLHALLPGDFVASAAYSLDDLGNVYGIASNNTDYFAVKWTVPEPTALPFILAFATACLRRKTA